MTAIQDWPLLSFLLIGPLAAAGLVSLLPGRWAAHLTAFTLVVELALSLLLLAGFDPLDAGWQWQERAVWLPDIGAHYHLAVDGISVLFLPSTALLFLGGLVVNWRSVPGDARLPWCMNLLLLSGTMGIFCALDLLLFFVCWELSLIPLYFLISGTGLSADRARVATRYTLIMIASGIPLLVAFIHVATQGGGGPTFDLPTLMTQPMAEGAQRLFLLLCLLGFAVKMPVVPLHTWLPQLALNVPGSLLAILLGLKVGGYALIRIALPLAPQAAQSWHWLLAGLGTVTLLYGAVAMLAQTNLRVGMAYASLSHMGLLLMGLSGFTVDGIHGAVSLLLSFTVASGGMMLLLECLRLRIGSNDIHALGGAARSMPLLATGIMICGLAGVGLPGTSSFPAEFLLIMSALATHTGAGMAALFGLAIVAGAFLGLYRQAFFGPTTQPGVQQAADLVYRERWLLSGLILIVFGIGLWPDPWLAYIQPAAERWLSDFRR